MYNIGVDTGGTFTDCVLVSPGMIPVMAKAETTPKNPAEGVINAIDRAAEVVGVSLQELLAHSRYVVHGTTHATNAMIERKGVRAGLIVTKGFEDVLFIGRGYQKAAGLPERELIHESQLDKAEPIITRDLIVGVSERTDREGEIIVPLNLEEAEKAVEFLLRKQVESIGICFLWSFLNPTNERTMKQIVRQKAPQVSVLTSEDVAPLMGEYERMATVALSAYLGPVVARYVTRLDDILKEQGFTGQLLLMHAGGGLLEAYEAEATPLLLLDSGPVGGTLGGKLVSTSLGKENIICIDMGGTSFDVSIVSRGQTFIEEQPVLSKYTYLSPSIQVTSIGAGGGSIVWVDPNGVLMVGPESAGAVPGPACYGKGGSAPTVTDVDAILGFLNPDYFLGGKVALHKELSETAIKRVAENLGMEVIEVAQAAFDIVNAHMADLIRLCTIERGLDPKEFTLLSYGGATATHVSFLAPQLGIKEVCIPPLAPAFSALGMLGADMLYSRQKSFVRRLPLPENDQRLLWEAIAEQKLSVSKQFERIGVVEDKVSWDYLLFMKYGLQVHELAVSLSQLSQNANVSDQLLEDFDRRYEEIYGRGAGYRGAGVEATKIRVEGRFRPPIVMAGEVKASLKRIKPAGAVKYRRKAYFPKESWIDIEIYDEKKLGPGNILPGPCIVERYADTVVIPPHAQGVVDRYLNIQITFE